MDETLEYIETNKEKMTDEIYKGILESLKIDYENDNSINSYEIYEITTYYNIIEQVPFIHSFDDHNDNEDTDELNCCYLKRELYIMKIVEKKDVEIRYVKKNSNLDTIYKKIQSKPIYDIGVLRDLFMDGMDFYMPIRELPPMLNSFLDPMEEHNMIRTTDVIYKDNFNKLHKTNVLTKEKFNRVYIRLTSQLVDN